MGNIPEDGPVLLVGNHSGGNLTPDTTVFTLAFYTYFGVERRLLPARPQPRPRLAGRADPAQYGTVAASHENAQQGAARRAPRCSSTPAATGRSTGRAGRRSKVDFDGRKGFIRLALNEDVPIVPVVSVGGQETALFLSRGERLARLLAARQAVPAQGAADLDSRRRGGSTSATSSATSRCRRRSRSRCCRRSTCASSSAPIPTSTRSTSTSPRMMQETLDALAAERRFPVIG